MNLKVPKSQRTKIINDRIIELINKLSDAKILNYILHHTNKSNEIQITEMYMKDSNYNITYINYIKIYCDIDNLFDCKKYPFQYPLQCALNKDNICENYEIIKYMINKGAKCSKSIIIATITNLFEYSYKFFIEFKLLEINFTIFEKKQNICCNMHVC